MIKKYICILLLIIAPKVYAQQQIIGTVLSLKDSTKVVGATVTIIEPSRILTTDSSGSFTTSLPFGKYSIVIKSLGYLNKEMKFSVPLENKFVIYLEESINNLDEVTINTGYQHISKERATGAFSLITNDLLNTTNGSNILGRLDGVASGVMFDVKFSSSAQRRLKFNVRGLSSINGSVDPLIVVDDFPYEGNINNIDPNDVESITILKDAAATSIWGARAGNGVVVITTKKGKISAKNNISIRNTLVFSEKSDHFKISQISSSDYIDIEEMLFSKGFYNSIITSQPFSALTPAVDVFLQRRNKVISAADSALRINELKNIDKRFDYRKYFLSQPWENQTYFNLNGGNEKYTYLFSSGYTRSRSELIAENERLNLRTSNTYRFSKGTSLDFGLGYTANTGRNGRANLEALTVGSRHVPYLDFVDDQGKAKEIPFIYNKDYVSKLANGNLLDWGYIPLDEHKYQKYVSKRSSFLTNIGINQVINSWISLNLKYQNELQIIQNNNLETEGSYQARVRVNTFTQFNPITNNLTYIVPKGGILSASNSNLVAHNFRGSLNISKKINDGEFSAIFGGEVRSTAMNNSSHLTYGYREDPLQSSVVDFVNRYPNVITGASLTIPNFNDFGGTLNKFISFFGNGSYTYKNKYILSASARKDASNIFGLNTNDKWKPLWSMGSSWDIAGEEWYKLEFLPKLKLRATMGFQGNVDLSRSALTILNYQGNNSITGLPVANVTQINNPELRWEKIRQLNFALDYALKNDIVRVSLELYLKRGKDLYAPVLMDYTTWGLNTTIVKNAAQMKGRGWELTLNSKNLKGNVTWNTNVIFNYNKDITVDYYSPEGYSAGIVGYGQAMTPLIGKPIYSLASYKWRGLDNHGNPQGLLNGNVSTDYSAIIADHNRNGLNGESFTFHGSSQPLYFGSLSNNIGYKDFALTFGFSYKLGYYFRRPSLSYSQLFQYGNGHGEFKNRWQKSGDELNTNVPSLIYPVNTNRDTFYNLSEATVERGDHIRLQYLNLSYSYATNSKYKSGFKNLSFHFNITNPYLIWTRNKLNLDPDYANVIPPSRSYTLGLVSNF